MEEFNTYKKPDPKPYKLKTAEIMGQRWTKKEETAHRLRYLIQAIEEARADGDEVASADVLYPVETADDKLSDDLSYLNHKGYQVQHIETDKGGYIKYQYIVRWTNFYADEY